MALSKALFEATYFCVFVCACASVQCASGLIADSRRVVDIAREEAQEYRLDYSQPIPAKVRSRVGVDWGKEGGREGWREREREREGEGGRGERGREGD